MVGYPASLPSYALVSGESQTPHEGAAVDSLPPLFSLRVGFSLKCAPDPAAQSLPHRGTGSV